ncbi:MAG: GTPase Era [Epsilonproteobacteria bacterium]|nr:GTPase Era [Campylobacterota bacterium]NPA89170.1 GTPase Era [Campylobacterota bacterium]
MTKAGFVGVVGRPNSGKSTLLNWLLGEKIALVSPKANATRKRINGIVMWKGAQIILVDTPGLHQQEKLLNKFMLGEALKTIGESDLLLFVADVRDNLEGYKWFLELNKKKIPHIVVLTKIDLVKGEDVEKKKEEYLEVNREAEIVPVSAVAGIGKEELLDKIVEKLSEHPYYFDPEIISTEHIRDIYKELIREALFEKLGDELPYETDVIIEKIEELPHLDRVYATIIAERSSQKGIIIGERGRKIKEIGMYARKLLEQFSGKKIYLELYVKVVPKWTKNKKRLADLGYRIEQ